MGIFIRWFTPRVAEEEVASSKMSGLPLSCTLTADVYHCSVSTGYDLATGAAQRVKKWLLSEPESRLAAFVLRFVYQLHCV